TLETTNVDGTAAGFSVINYPTMTVNQIQEFTISLASSLVTQGELSTTNGNVSANTAAIANANTAIGTKVATTDFEAFKTTNTAEINAKVAQTAYDTKMAALDASIASNTTAIATKAAQTAVDNLNGKPVRTIDAAGVEIGMSLGAYTTSALDNGLIDKSVLDKRTTIDIATKAEVNTKAPQATTYTKAQVDAAIASAINALPKAPTRK
ncbi:hypothetical protein, partial [Modestobacter marinus]|uniref:hypothetical protein n=1 Tax=Modestobacter marinus TaxID=477641 RepID=UPI001C981D13